MCEHGKRRERDGDQAFPPAATPENCNTEKRQAQRNIKIQEAHLEGIAIAEDGDDGAEQPGRALGGGADQGERAPEENQYGERHRNFFGGVQRDKAAEAGEKIVEEYIVPARREPQARRVSVADEVREPRGV